MRSISPYSYAFNNPVYFADFEGLIPWPVPLMYKNWTRKSPDEWYGFIPKRARTHHGLDINYSGGGNTDLGAPILATHDGTVVSVKTTTTGGSGRMIIIKSPDGSFQTRYMHLSSVTVTAGQEISEGQTIGLMGGSAFGKELGRKVHLHYEIHKLNSDGNFTSYNPTQGRGNNVNNIVDPQSWINTSNSNPFFTLGFDKPYVSGFNFKLDLPIINMPFYFNSSNSTRASLSPISPITPASLTPIPLSLPTPGPSPSPMPVPNPSPANIPNFIPNRLD
jgi:murein DD-endopeptidase MepM/ murein hydrolase activator NlpD